MPIQVTLPKVRFYEKFKMADGRHFENRYLNISAVNYPISIKFGTQMQISIPTIEI